MYSFLFVAFTVSPSTCRRAPKIPFLITVGATTTTKSLPRQACSNLEEAQQAQLSRDTQLWYNFPMTANLKPAWEPRDWWYRQWQPIRDCQLEDMLAWDQWDAGGEYKGHSPRINKGVCCHILICSQSLKWTSGGMKDASNTHHFIFFKNFCSCALHWIRFFWLLSPWMGDMILVPDECRIHLFSP